jgi:hypothetical protein
VAELAFNDPVLSLCVKAVPLILPLGKNTASIACCSYERNPVQGIYFRFCRCLTPVNAGLPPLTIKIMYRQLFRPKQAILAAIVFPFLFSISARCQDHITISGIVKDKRSGESLIGASIRLQETAGGAVTNAYGFFSLTVPKASYSLAITYIGYQVYTQKLSEAANVKLIIEMSAVEALQEVVVTSKKKNDHISGPIMGVEKLSINALNQLPVLLGERDVLKSIQLLPGIKSAGEGNSGFYVRGGGTDQNLILLDEAPVYNASHLLGFLSTFNSDAVKDITVYKGGMPAQYGGRLSGVVDIKMKDGNNKNYDVSGGIGLLSSRLNIEGPIVPGKGSFIISGRRSYVDAFLGLSSDSAFKNTRIYFYDLNLKANYAFGKKDKLFLSGYFGRDVLKLDQTINTDWGNKTSTLRWNHIIHDRLFSNTSLIFSDYDYKIKVSSGADKFIITSKIKDLDLKEDVDYYINARQKIKFGGSVIRHTVFPAGVYAEFSNVGKITNLQDRNSWESALYVSHEWTFNDKLNMNYGLRLSNITATGPGLFYTYDNSGKAVDSINYAKGKTIASYWNLEPRFSLSFQLTEAKSVKLSYNRNTQNLHLLSNATSASPTDLWLASNNNIRPEISDQVAAGYYQSFQSGAYEASMEVYYKTMQNQIDYRDGAVLSFTEHIESELVYGSGRAYGIELLVKKKSGLLTGWVGYTLSRSEKKFDGINNGRYFNARQDRTHDFSIVAAYKSGPRWTFSGTFVYSTGSAVTFPSGKYSVNGQTIFLYTERNGYRMPAYHRLDLAATVENKHNRSRKYQSSWTFSLYNAYGQPNAYFIQFKDDPRDRSRTIAERTSLFSFVPGVTWNFKF